MNFATCSAANISLCYTRVYVDLKLYVLCIKLIEYKYAKQLLWQK